MGDMTEPSCDCEGDFWDMREQFVGAIVEGEIKREEFTCPMCKLPIFTAAYINFYKEN
jgi:hypothetical protein